MSRNKQAARKGRVGPLALTKVEKDKTQVALPKMESDSIEDKDTKLTAIPPMARKQVHMVEESDDAENSGAATPHKANTTKLKRCHEEFESGNQLAPSPAAKKKKYKSKEERKAVAMKRTNTEESGAGDNFDPAIAQMDPSLLADHFAKTTKRHYKQDTAVELDEKYLPSTAFANMKAFTADRKKDKLGPFLEAVVAGDRSKLTSAAKETARPHTIVLCQSGIRAADLARILRAYESTGNGVVKLFAKHFKIEQQAIFLRKNKTGFGVGTPQRINELIRMGALKLDNLARIVIDGSYLDEKQGGIWRMPEVFKAVLSMLKMETIQERIETGELKVVVF